MDRIQKFLSSKIGPVPVSLILAVMAAAALWAVIRFVPRQESGEEDVSEESDGDPVVSDLTGTTAGYGPFIASRPLPTGAAYQEPTNDSWVRQGVQWLSGEGVPADAAQIALQRYLAGDDLTYEQDQMKDRVVTKFGVPPTLPSDLGNVGSPPSPTPADPGPVPNLRLERRMTRWVHLMRWGTTPTRGSYDQIEVMIYRQNRDGSWRKIWGPKRVGKRAEQKVQVTPGYNYEFRVRFWNDAKKSTPSGPWTTYRWRA